MPSHDHITSTLKLARISHSALNGLGIFITLVGGAWYTKLEMEEKQRKNQLMQLPIHGDGSKVASTVLMGDVPMSVKTHQ